jgi:hypothetical protein
MRTRALLLVGVIGALVFGSPPIARAVEDTKSTDAGRARRLAEELTLEELMAAFARVRGIWAEFRETKELALLMEPLVSTGEIFIVPPDRLLRRTTSTAPATLVIDGDSLRFEDELGREEIDLAAQPQARQFVDQMLAVLSGDLAALRARYEVDYEASADHWQLTLVPSGFPMRHLVERIELRGDGPELREMVLIEKDGDRTTSVFEKSQIDRVFSEAELAQLFGSPASATPARPSEAGAR